MMVGRLWRAIISLVAVAVAPFAQAATTTANVNCRTAATVQSSIVERIGAREHVSVIGRSASWSKIERNVSCWVSDRYLASEISHQTDTNSRAYRTSVRQSSGKLETRRANRRSFRNLTRRSSARRSRRSTPAYFYGGSSCPCSGGNVCIGPRGGRYCITSGGNKRYGV